MIEMVRKNQVAPAPAPAPAPVQQPHNEEGDKFPIAHPVFIGRFPNVGCGASSLGRIRFNGKPDLRFRKTKEMMKAAAIEQERSQVMTHRTQHREIDQCDRQNILARLSNLELRVSYLEMGKILQNRK